MKQPSVSATVAFRPIFNPDRRRGQPLRRIFGALSLAAVAAAASAVASEVPVAFRNTGMEEGTGTPAGWQKGPAVAGVQQVWDQKIAHGGKASLCLRKTAQRYFPIAQWSQFVPIAPENAARKLKVRCWVKTEAVTKAIVDVYYQGSSPQPGHAWAIFLGQKQDTDPILTHDWKLYEGVVEVPANSSKIGIALQIYGPGSVWFDDLQVAWIHD